MDGYFNSAKNPADWPWSLNRSTEDLVTLTPSHSQLACTYDLIEAITSTDPLRFEEFDRDLTSFALVKKQWQERTEMRQNAAKTLSNMLAKFADGCSVHMVGSWASGCGAESSDLDITLVAKDQDGRFCASKGFMLTTLSRVHSLLASAAEDRFTHIEFLKETRFHISSLQCVCRRASVIFASE